MPGPAQDSKPQLERHFPQLETKNPLFEKSFSKISRKRLIAPKKNFQLEKLLFPKSAMEAVGYPLIK